MTPIPVLFKTKIMNPAYQFGVTSQVEPQIEITGAGRVVAFPSSGNAIVLSDSTGKFYLVGLSEITFVQSP